VSFSFTAGGMGPVHVGVGLRAGAVSVKLAAENAQAASDLRSWLPELKTALEASDLTVDEVSARRGTAAFDPSSQSRSITI
jgi:flagellar hook-length control protein FliK